MVVAPQKYTCTRCGKEGTYSKINPVDAPLNTFDGKPVCHTCWYGFLNMVGITHSENTKESKNE